MKIVALIDLTPLCKKAIEYGAAIAKKTDAHLILLHVSNEGAIAEDEARSDLQELKKTVGEGVRVTTQVADGEFFSVIPILVQDLEADLVVVPTHGKVGIMQNLFGANILKLVKSLPCPTLVVQQTSVLGDGLFSKVLFPVGPHDDFNIKTRQTAQFAKHFGSTVQIYLVKNDIRGIPDKLRKNISEAKDHFRSVGVQFEEIMEEPTGFSVGYAKHILGFAENSDTNVISIMAKVSDDNGYIGNNDKENILLNTAGLPVFCSNQV